MSNSQPINISFEFREDGQGLICSATSPLGGTQCSMSLKRFAHVAKHLGEPRTKGLMMQEALMQLFTPTEL